MKHNIEQLLSASISDNANFIKQSGRITVDEYLLDELEASGDWYYYLSEEEAKDFDNDPEYRKQVESEIEEYIKDNYNYPVDEL